jgi:hypothetical protein
MLKQWPETMKTLARCQDVLAEVVPGYGDDAVRLTINDGARSLSDVFVIKNEIDLNRAANSLMRRLVALGEVHKPEG